MPKYRITDPSSGQSFQLSFPRKPTDEELREAVERVLGVTPGWTVGGWGESVGKRSVLGLTELGAWAYGAGAFADRLRAEIYDTVGFSSAANQARFSADWLDDAARNAQTWADVERKKVQKELPQHEFAGSVGEAVATVLPTFPASAAAGAAGLGFRGVMGVASLTAGSIGSAAELQTQRVKRLVDFNEEYGGADRADLELMAIGGATPWALLSGATTAATTYTAGTLGGKLLGTGGIETAGAGKAAIQAAATGRFSTKIPWMRGRGVGRGTARLTAQTGLEAVEEGFDETLQAYVVQRLSTDPDITFSDALTRGKEAAAIGAFFGGVLGGVGTKASLEQAENKADANLAAMKEVFGASSERIIKRVEADLEQMAVEDSTEAAKLGLPTKTNIELMEELKAKYLGAPAESPSEVFKSWLAKGQPKATEAAPPVMGRRRGSPVEGEEISASRMTDVIMEEGKKPPTPPKEAGLEPTPVKSTDAALNIKARSVFEGLPRRTGEERPMPAGEKAGEPPAFADLPPRTGRERPMPTGEGVAVSAFEATPPRTGRGRPMPTGAGTTKGYSPEGVAVSAFEAMPPKTGKERPFPGKLVEGAKKALKKRRAAKGKRRRKGKSLSDALMINAAREVGSSVINVGLEAAIATAEAASNVATATEVAVASLDAAMDVARKANPRAFKTLGSNEIRELFAREIAKRARPVAFNELVNFGVVDGVPFDLTYAEYESVAGEVIHHEVQKAVWASDLPIDVDHEVEVLTKNGWTELLREVSVEPDIGKTLDMPRGVWDEKGIAAAKEGLATSVAERELSSFHNNINWYTENRDQKYENTRLEEVLDKKSAIKREFFESDEAWQKAISEAEDSYHFADPEDKIFELHPLRGATVKVESEASKNWEGNPMFTHTTAYGNIDSIAETGLRANAEIFEGGRIAHDRKLFFVAPVDFKTYWGNDGVGPITRWVVSDTQGIDMAKGKKVVLGWKEDAMARFTSYQVGDYDWKSVPLDMYAEPDEGMSHWNEAWSKGSSMENPSRVISETPEYFASGGRAVNISPDDLFVWDGKDWKPFKDHVTRLKADRAKNVLKRWQDKVRSLKKKMGGSLFARLDLGVLNLPVELVDASLTIAIKSIDAGVSLSESLSRSYTFLRRPDVSESQYKDYILGRMDEAMNQLSKGNSMSGAVKASALPFSGKIYSQIQEDEAKTALEERLGLPPATSDIKDFRHWTNKYLPRFFMGSSDVVAGNGAFVGLSARMEAHVDYNDKYSGMLTAMLLESGDPAAPSFLETKGAWDTWAANQSEEAKQAEVDFALYQEANFNDDIVALNRVYRSATPMGRSLIDGWKRVAVVTGELMKDEEIEVRYPDGSKRKFIMMGERFWPRAMKPEYTSALNSLDASSEMTQSLMDIGNALKKAGEIEVVSVDSIRKWWNSITGGRGQKGDMTASFDKFNGYRQQDAFMASLDRARTGRKLPAELMDFSLNASRRYIFNWSERFAQIKAFGQKARDGKDLFEIVADNLTEHGYTKDELKYIGKLRDAAYGISDSDLDWFGRRLMFLNKIATATMLTGGFNAMRNMTGMGPTSAIFGYGNSIKSLWKMQDYAAAAKQTRAWGVLRDDLALMLAGHDIAVEGEGYIEQADKRALTPLTKKALRWSGFTQSENFVRTHAALTASAFASEGIGAVKKEGNPALAKEFTDMAERLGVDWRRMVAEDNSQGEETGKFIRKSVKEVQGGYRYNQLPAFMSNPMGKFMFKFGAYGMQISRMMYRNAVKPAFKGNFMPLLRLMATAAGSGELLYALRDLLFGKARPDATLHEIFKGEDRLYKMFFRLLNDVTYAGTMGLVGDMAGLVKNVATKQRVKSPFDPAGMQIIENTTWFFIDRLNERTLHKPWEWRLGIHRFLESQFSAYRYGRSGLMNLANTGGVEWDMVLRERAVQDQRFLRNATMRFQESVGDDLKNKIGAGKFTPSPYTRFYRNVKDELSLKDVPGARKAAITFSEQLSPEDRSAAWRRLSSSIMRSQPMKVGDSTSKEIKEEFISWARRNLSEKEVNTIMKVQKTYMDTAINAGLVGESPSSLSRPMKLRMNLQPPKSRSRRIRRMDSSPEAFLRKERKQAESVFGY